jgi:hypothetical protein
MFKNLFFVIGLSLLLSSAPTHSMASALAAPLPQSGDQRTSLQQDLASQFKLTRMTADRSDIVKAGSVLELQKDGLVMTSVDTLAPPTSTYKNGKVGMNFGAVLSWNMQLGGTNSNDVPQRKFVAGEKFWVTAYNIEEDGVVFTFFSDPYNDVRYYGKLKVSFPKHTIPPADEVMKTIAEVITAEPSDNADQGVPPAKAPAPAPAPTQQTKLPPIPPPPPPPDAPPPQPKTITLGMTKDQVVAIFGQPKRIANLSGKEIDYYDDMKVTFVKGKVTDVQ